MERDREIRINSQLLGWGRKSECHLARMLILLVSSQTFFDDCSGWGNSTRDDSLSVG